jgi:hypothetical protein
MEVQKLFGFVVQKLKLLLINRFRISGIQLAGDHPAPALKTTHREVKVIKKQEIVMEPNLDEPMVL